MSLGWLSLSVLASYWVPAPCNTPSVFVDADRKACSVKQTLQVDLEGNARPRTVEWRQCPCAGCAKDQRIDLIVLRGREPAGADVVLYRPDTHVYLSELKAGRLDGVRSEVLLMVEHVQGTGGWSGAWLVAMPGPKALCLRPPVPDSTRHLDASERLSKGWHVSLVEGSVVLTAPVFGPDDANCCPTRGELRMELMYHQNKWSVVSVDRAKDPPAR